LPVGNSDKGVGLFAGQIMVGTDFNYQYIDWAHPEIDGEEDPSSGELVGEHLGTLTAYVINPSITIGLSDYWNFTFSQVIGKRHMTWGNDKESVHHRPEDSNSNFINAIGGLLGDSRLMFRYLAINAGAGVGNRLFFGGGLVIPSKNTLTSSPFFLNGDEPEPHRHFSMSEGVYKGVIETQYFIKRVTNPVFVGGTFSIVEPLGESDDGFKASRMIDLSFTAFTKKINFINGSAGASLMFRRTYEGFWNGEPAPNSESLLVTPGVGLLLNAKIGVVALNLQRPFFIDGGVSGGGNSASQEETSVWQISVSFRRILDYSIPWLYW
tara:strand:+ start:22 stop:993 length:972 start_codon:yes stop_codon:yes gene_type:complete